MRQPVSSANPAVLFSKASALRTKSDLSGLLAVAPRCAILSLEFVAKPESARSAPLSLPADVQAAFAELTGFRGSMVMVSEQEPRLITAVIFWNSCDWQQSSSQCARRARAVLAPYVDRSLRIQTMVAHLPAPHAEEAEQTPADSGYIDEESVAQEENVCAA
ncbi:MAG TPA: hypothetical protein VFI60_04685 [Candidatus Acidoferrum sp.]|nr:hypothetical protein [Candidatus Acidoferrum sp.]